MHILGIEWLNLSITTITVIYCFVCVGMIFLILLQRPKQEGLGAAFGANMAGEIFGSRVTTVLQKGTVYLASMFFIITLVLAILVQKRNTISGNSNISVAVAEAPAKVEEQPVSLQAELPAEAALPVQSNAEGNTVNTAPVELPVAEIPAVTTPTEAVVPPANVDAPPANAAAPVENPAAGENKPPLEEDK